VAIPERILCVFASLRLCVSSFLQPINDSKDHILDQLRTEIDQQSQTKVCQATGSAKKKELAQRRKDAKENQRDEGYYLFDPVCSSRSKFERHRQTHSLICRAVALRHRENLRGMRRKKLLVVRNLSNKSHPQIAQIFIDEVNLGVILICDNLRNLWIIPFVKNLDRKMGTERFLGGTPFCIGRPQTELICPNLSVFPLRLSVSSV